MIKVIDKTDHVIAGFINSKISSRSLNRILSRINRGETLLLVVIISLFFYRDVNLYVLLPHIGIVAYITDRMVLFFKKWAARHRPLISVAGGVDQNPDMKHSFPSAHAANSMVVTAMLVLIYGFSPWFILMSIFAGVGRLLSLHHFLSDVLGGWVFGFFVALLNFLAFLWYSGNLQ